MRYSVVTTDAATTWTWNVGVEDVRDDPRNLLFGTQVCSMAISELANLSPD